jgi:hypothetical protein
LAVGAFTAVVTDVWAEAFGQVDKIGMEGTGSFGAGLLRFLAHYGLAQFPGKRNWVRAGNCGMLQGNGRALSQASVGSRPG